MAIQSDGIGKFFFSISIFSLTFSQSMKRLSCKRK
ncbi:hypothetical protein V6Z11_D13G161300 [Gossypium hirsutum]